jgi:phospholipase/carboxylesterase/glyoxalase family protein
MSELPFVHRYEPSPGPGDVPAPLTLLLLHGTGGDENDLLGLGRSLAPDASLLSPRGRVLERGAPRWFRRLAEGVFDVPDLVARTHELSDFVAASSREHGFDPAGVVAVGFSNGANIAAAMLLLRPECLRAAVLLAPMVPLEPDEPGDLSGVAVFIGAGRNDPIAPPDHVAALAELLSDRGAAVEVHWHPGGHQIDRSTLAAAQAWLGKLRAAMAVDPLP